MTKVLIRNGADTTKLNLFKTAREHLNIKDQILLAKAMGLEAIIPNGYDTEGNIVPATSTWTVTCVDKFDVTATNKDEAIAIARSLGMEGTLTAVQSVTTSELIEDEEEDSDEDYEE